MTKSFATEIELAQALVQAPSPSGAEGPAARVFCAALQQLGYAEVHLDAAGNAVGEMRCGAGPVLLFNGHLDTVPVGEVAEWPVPPLAGAIVDGRLWGRGACDMKAALACMAFAGRDARAAGFRGTLVVSGVVQEEVGGLGARFLAEQRRADAVVLGEPSKLHLMLGHRGRVEVHARVPGRMAHAARNILGENALYRAAALLEQLQRLALPAGGPLGSSSLTPTQLTSLPLGGANVVPGAAELTIDYRNIPGDDPAAILERLRALDPGVRFELPTEESRSEDGAVRYVRPRVVEPYLAPPEHALVERARGALGRVLGAKGQPLEEGYWWFCTDAPELAAIAPVVLGCGPGEEELAHTTNESVLLDQLTLAREVYGALALELLA